MVDIFFANLATIVDLITLLGVPTAICVYSMEQRQRRMEREYGTYDALDDKYIELQQLCLNHVELDVFDTPYDKPRELSEQQKKQEDAILYIRIAIFERAYLMYKRSRSKGIRKNQWAGWEIEIREWLERENFRALWALNRQYFDQEFIEFFDRHLDSKAS